MSEHKFEPGDRVKAKEDRSPAFRHKGLVTGEVYTVRSVDQDGDVILDNEDPNQTTGWYATLFTLHAKAGQFVPGDRVVVMEVIAGGPAVGEVATVHAGHSHVELLRADGAVYAGGGWNRDRFRLATAEEIAAADAEAAASKHTFQIGDEIELISQSYGDLVRGDRVTVIKTETYAGGAPGVKWKPGPGKNTHGGYAERFRLVKKATGTEGATGRKPGEPISTLAGPFVVGDVVECVAEARSPHIGVGKRGQRYELTGIAAFGGLNFKGESLCGNLIDRFRLAIPAGGFKPGDLVECSESFAGYITAGKRYALRQIGKIENPAFTDDRGGSRFAGKGATQITSRLRLISRPDANGWHAWAGGEKPSLAEGTKIEVRNSFGDVVRQPHVVGETTTSWDGRHAITAFRIIATEAADVTIKGDTPPLRFTSPATPEPIKLADIAVGDHLTVKMNVTKVDTFDGLVLGRTEAGASIYVRPEAIATHERGPLKVGDRVRDEFDGEGTIRYIEDGEVIVRLDTESFLVIANPEDLTRI